MTLLFICVFVTESRIKRHAKKTSLPKAQAAIVQTSKQRFFSDAHISVAAGKSCLPLAAGAVARLAGRWDRVIFAGVAQCFNPMDITVQLFVIFLQVIFTSIL